MEVHEKSVATAVERVAATRNPGISHILVQGQFTSVPTLRLRPGQALIGVDERAAVTFEHETDGVQLSTDNRLQSIRVVVSPNKRALFNDTGVSTLGAMVLRDVTAVGQVQLLARDNVRGGHVEVDGLDIIAADSRGPREFNVYMRTVHRAEFERVTTHADGSVGVQLSQPIGRLLVRRGIETFGGAGPSLVKGVVVPLSAIGLSLKPGGSAREITINGGIITHGAGVAPVELHGAIKTFHVTGGIRAEGGGFEAI